MTRKGYNRSNQVRLKEKFNFKDLPRINTLIRPFTKTGNRYVLADYMKKIETAEQYMGAAYFKRSLSAFKHEYWYLPLKTRKKSLTFRLMEILVGFGRVKVSAGYNWIAMGRTINGKKYMAIIDVMVRPMFRNCGLMSYMKRREIQLARSEKCDFIETWHYRGNPHFNSAIIPGLKCGFVLYHGKDEEYYENKGCIHLRYYFGGQTKQNVQVLFRDGTRLQSPKENGAIIDHLLEYGEKAGKSIRKIYNLPPYP